MAPIYLLLCLVYVFSDIVRVTAQPLQLSVLENQPIGTILGSVTNSSEFLSTVDPSQRADLRYKIFAQGNPWTGYFNVDEVTGQIRTSAVLDREILCQGKDCTLDLDIAVHSNTFVRLFRVEITVLDINDNTPEFPEPEIKISIPESVGINYTVPISGAADRDTGEDNGIKRYEIIPADGEFGLNVIENLDGIREVGIVVVRKLDRETQSSYRLQILAKDGGSIIRTGTLDVNIIIEDVNDHTPKFTKSSYSVSVLESLAINSSISRVTATDKDVGDNGKVMYRLSSRSTSKFPGLFSIDEKTGEVRLAGSVDYEQNGEFRLIIEALDNGTPQLTAQALVTVTIEDVNDNSPSVNFNFLSETSSAEIPEDAQLEDFVAHVSVIDGDEGANAVVDCTTDSLLFKIDRLYDNEFQVVLNSSLDRERTAEFNVTVICTDRGVSPLTGSGTFLVFVLDVNDNEPKFNQTAYSVTVSESMSVGTEIVTVVAHDSDISRNGKVTYVLFGESRDYFKIDEDTGVIVLNQALDYETRNKITVYVEARDGGTPTQMTSTAIDLIITDVNDESPEYNQSSYVFEIAEEPANGTVVGIVRASDPDKSFHGKVKYSVESPSAPAKLFNISKDGTIRTQGRIDRETYSQINLTVIATDENMPAQRTSAEVLVRVLDINDNAPVITFPDNMNNTVVLTKEQQDQEAPFTTILASDTDSEENQTLLYEIVDDDLSKTFRVNPNNGSLWLVKKDQLTDRQTYILNIVVKDKGNPPLESTARLFVVTYPVGRPEQSYFDVNANVMIVVIVISITSVLSLVIFIGICYVRRSSAKSQGPAAENDELPPPSADQRSVQSTKIEERSSSTSTSKDNETNELCAERCYLQTKQECRTSDKLKLPLDEKSTKSDRDSTARLPPSPIDIFDLAQHGHTGIWLNYLRQTQIIPRTSSTNSRYTVNSFSNMSLDTMTSDSGRGTSEQDSREQLDIHDARSIPAPISLIIPDSMDGDYIDMQRSPLPQAPSKATGDRAYGNVPHSYEPYLDSRGMLPLGTPRESRQCRAMGDNSLLKTNSLSEACSVRANEQLGVISDVVPELNTKLTLNNTEKTATTAGCYRTQQSLSDSDDDATTTSGSYTVDLRDFSEFEGLPTAVISPELNV